LNLIKETKKMELTLKWGGKILRGSRKGRKWGWEGGGNANVFNLRQDRPPFTGYLAEWSGGPTKMYRKDCKVWPFHVIQILKNKKKKKKEGEKRRESSFTNLHKEWISLRLPSSTSGGEEKGRRVKVGATPGLTQNRSNNRVGSKGGQTWPVVGRGSPKISKGRVRREGEYGMARQDAGVLQNWHPKSITMKWPECLPNSKGYRE